MPIISNGLGRNTVQGLAFLVINFIFFIFFIFKKRSINISF